MGSLALLIWSLDPIFGWVAFAIVVAWAAACVYASGVFRKD